MRKIYVSGGIVALIAVAIFGYVRWDQEQRAREQAAVFALMASTTNGLRAGIESGRDPAMQSKALRAAAERSDEDLAALRATPTERVPELRAGAIEYLDTARELLKRRALIVTLNAQVLEGMRTFRHHMLNRRDATNWTGEAVRLKGQLEENFRTLQRTVETHTKLSGDFADVYPLIAAQVPSDALVALDEVAAVRQRVSELGRVVGAEMDSLRHSMAPRS